MTFALKIWQILLSLFFWLFVAISSIVLFNIALVIFFVTLLFDRRGKLLHLFSCFWAQLYFYLNPFWRLHIDGRSLLPWNDAAVLVANHQSVGDILVLYGLYRPFKWVSKASMFKVPFVGWNMVINRYVSLVRGNKDSIAKMMRDCKTWLDLKMPVLMFPEGTRSEDGEIKNFKDGAFRLAIDQNCPVFPIVLSGTRKTLPKHGIILRENAKCLVTILPAVHPKDFNHDIAKFREHVRLLMCQEKRRLDQTLMEQSRGRIST